MDDCIAIGSRKEFAALAKSVDAQYSITGLGEVRWVLGMLLEHDLPAHTTSRSKEGFLDSIVAPFTFTDATTVVTPLQEHTIPRSNCPTLKDQIEEMANQPYREPVGALVWLALGTRSDTAFATSSPARFGHNLGRVYWDVAKRVLRYLKGTKQWRLALGARPPEIAAFTDTEWGSHRDDRRSIGE